MSLRVELDIYTPTLATAIGWTQHFRPIQDFFGIKFSKRERFPMRIIASTLVLLGVFSSAPSWGQVINVSNHSLPGAKVATYHVKCVGGRLGIIRLDSILEPRTVCAAVQDGSKPEVCVAVSKTNALPVVDSSAAALCR